MAIGHTPYTRRMAGVLGDRQDLFQNVKTLGFMLDFSAAEVIATSAVLWFEPLAIGPGSDFSTEFGPRPNSKKNGFELIEFFPNYLLTTEVNGCKMQK